MKSPVQPLIMLVVSLMGCSDAHRASVPETQPPLSKETALMLSTNALNIYYKSNPLEREHVMEATRGQGYWFVHFAFLPRTPEDEIFVKVEDNKKVTVNGRIME